MSFLVEASRTIAYARATNDPIAEHVNGVLAPPVFAVVPAWEALVEAMAGVAPPEMLPLLVHGEQDIHVKQPIVPGMELETTAKVIGVQAKSSGTTVTTHSVTSTVDGQPVNEQYLVTFIRSWQAEESWGSAAPDHTFSTPETRPDEVVVTHIDQDQTFRYAEASGDPMTIHLDEEVAKAVGLPGIIAHGLCTMAFTSWGAITSLCEGDPRRLKRIAVRFSQPLLPGQEITTRFWGNSFETTSDSGAVVIKNGLIERV
jgi:acyl dehydratase